MFTNEETKPKHVPQTVVGNTKSKNPVPAPNLTGIPDVMKMQFEDISGLSFDDVRVHYNSVKPLQLQALAYTQGNQVHIAPGQESHLRHELGHVIQQKQNRVQANIVYKGENINNDESLEHEADIFAIRTGVLSMESSIDSRSVGQASQFYGLNPAIQADKWRWNGTTNKWICIEGSGVKKPNEDGTEDGQIIDDEPMLKIEGKGLKKPEPPIHLDTPYIEDPVEYGDNMAALLDMMRGGAELDEKQISQLHTWFSNAKLLQDAIKSLAEKSPDEAKKWSDVLGIFEREAGISVFTRDIDAGELKAQPLSGGTMSVVDRMAHGFGRIRNHKDLDRGGGAGSYVRFIADKKQRSALTPKPAESSQLDKGGIASSGGVTVLYDSISVVKDNSAPAHIAFNPQDSAGRVFGTMADSPEEFRAKRGESEHVLSKANPNPLRPVEIREDTPTLTPEYIMKNALQGLSEMTRQSTGQKPEEEYNEAILFSGAKIKNIKAVLIHNPVASTGRPPTIVKFTPEQKERQARRVERILAEKEANIKAISQEIDAIDSTVEEILKTKDFEEVKQVKQLESQKTALIKERDAWHRKSVPEVLDFRSVRKPEVSTSVAIRSRVTWEGHSVPKELQPWLNYTGYGGVPMKYLFIHVNPSKIVRSQLPELAQSVWARGKAAWEDDSAKEREKEKMEDRMKSDASNLQLTITPIRPTPLGKVPSAPTATATAMPQPSSPTAPKTSKKEESGTVLTSEMRTNNCLINAICKAGRGDMPTDAEILAIRTQLLPMGYKYGEMLFASERVLRVIVNVLNIVGRRVYVHYQAIGDEEFFTDNPPANPVVIKHRGAHFSEGA